MTDGVYASRDMPPTALHLQRSDISPTYDQTEEPLSQPSLVEVWTGWIDWEYSPISPAPKHTSMPHKHAHMHACTHAHTHTHTHKRKHTHACTHACTHTSMHTCTHSRRHTRTHARTHARIQGCTHVRTYEHARSKYAGTHARTHECSHTVACGIDFASRAFAPPHLASVQACWVLEYVPPFMPEGCMGFDGASLNGMLRFVFSLSRTRAEAEIVQQFRFLEPVCVVCQLNN